jgi:hypothetical protein
MQRNLMGLTDRVCWLAPQEMWRMRAAGSLEDAAAGGGGDGGDGGRTPKAKREKPPPKKKPGLWLPGMPWKVDVTCRKNSGVMRLRGEVVIICDRTGKAMTPSQFELSCGALSKKWRYSIRVSACGTEVGPWLEQQVRSHLLATLRLPRRRK